MHTLTNVNHNNTHTHTHTHTNKHTHTHTQTHTQTNSRTHTHTVWSTSVSVCGCMDLSDCCFMRVCVCWLVFHDCLFCYLWQLSIYTITWLLVYAYIDKCMPCLVDLYLLKNVNCCAVYDIYVYILLCIVMHISSVHLRIHIYMYTDTFMLCRICLVYILVCKEMHRSSVHPCTHTCMCRDTYTLHTYMYRDTQIFHTSIYASMQVWSIHYISPTYRYRDTYGYTYIYIWYMYIHTYLQINIYMYIYVYICIYMYTYVYIYIYTCIYIHIQMYIFVCIYMYIYLLNKSLYTYIRVRSTIWFLRLFTGIGIYIYRASSIDPSNTFSSVFRKIDLFWQSSFPTENFKSPAPPQPSCSNI